MTLQKLVRRFPFVPLAFSFILATMVGSQGFGQFSTVINVPPDSAPDSIGSDTQLNLLDGGVLPSDFDAGERNESNDNVEVNILGGSVGDRFQANNGSTVTISGGSVDDFFDANRDSTVTISGGSVGDSFEAHSSTVTISDGSIGNGFRAYERSEVTISGGSIGHSFGARSGSTVTISGGSFGNNFRAYGRSEVTISGGMFGLRFNVDSGGMATVSGGSIGDDFVNNGIMTISGGEVGDNFNAGGVVNISGGTFGQGFNAMGHVTISDGSFGDNFVAFPPSHDLRTNIRVIIYGGEVGDNFSTGGKRSKVNIWGGSVGHGFDADSGSTVSFAGGSMGRRFNANDGSTVTISGGDVGGDFNANSGSRVNISGGLLGDGFKAFEGSEVVLVGTEFRLDGQGFPDLVNPGDSLVLTARDGLPLSGTLRDGTQLDFDLNSLDPANPGDFFDADATLRLMLALDCDFDFNSTCDVGDIDMLLGAIGTNHVNFNLDGSGAVDFDDVEVWLTVAGNETIGRPYLMGDTDFNGFIDSADLGEIGLRWQQTSSVTSWSEGDFNADGTINAVDLNILGKNWQQTAAAAATVPEPSGLILALAVLVAMLRNRREVHWRRRHKDFFFQSRWLVTSSGGG